MKKGLTLLVVIGFLMIISALEIKASKREGNVRFTHGHVFAEVCADLEKNYSEPDGDSLNLQEVMDISSIVSSNPN